MCHVSGHVCQCAMWYVCGYLFVSVFPCDDVLHVCLSVSMHVCVCLHKMDYVVCAVFCVFVCECSVCFSMGRVFVHGVYYIYVYILCLLCVVYLGCICCEHLWYGFLCVWEVSIGVVWCVCVFFLCVGSPGDGCVCAVLCVSVSLWCVYAHMHAHSHSSTCKCVSLCPVSVPEVSYVWDL